MVLKIDAFGLIFRNFKICACSIINRQNIQKYFRVNKNLKSNDKISYRDMEKF